MTQLRRHAWLRNAGLATGFLISVVAILGWRVPHGSGKLGLDLQMSAAQTGELQVSPLAPFLSGSGMKGGDARTGSFTVRNETGKALGVRLRGGADVRDADRSLRIRIAAGSEQIFAGSLGDLRTPTARALVVPRAGTRRIRVTALLPESAPDGYAGRILSVQLQPVAVAR